MAYMNQEQKKILVAEAKKALKKFKNVKYTFSVRNHSTIVMNIKSGDIDFIENHIENFRKFFENDNYTNIEEQKKYLREKKYIDVNNFHYEKAFSGEALEFIKAAHVALNIGNHDRSDSMTDYFDVGWYVDINIGNWNKPYEFKPGK